MTVVNTSARQVSQCQVTLYSYKSTVVSMAWNRRARNHKVFNCVFSFLDAVYVCVPVYMSMHLSSMCLPGKSQDTQNITLGFLNCAPATPQLGQLLGSKF